MDNNLAQIYQIVSIAAFSLAGVCFVFAVFCFFKFRIIKIMNDLSGRTAKKSIAKIRNANEKAGDKSFRLSPKAKARGTKADKIPMDKPEISLDANATEILTDKNVTEFLSEGTALLNNDCAQASVSDSKFEIIQSTVLIHTNEVI